MSSLVQSPSKIAPGTARPRILESSPIHEGCEAEEYDTMIRHWAWILNKPFAAMVSKLNLKQGCLLDIGSGPGWVAIELAQKHPMWEITAIDASSDMLARAERNAAESGVAGRIRFMQADALNLPFDTGRFDVSISQFVLHHIPKPEQFFNEMARVTRGGGKIVIKDLYRPSALKARLLLAFSKHVLRYTNYQLKMYSESLDAGLTHKEVRESLDRSKLAMAKLKAFNALDFVITA